MNGVHLSGVLPGRLAVPGQVKENNMTVTPSAPPSDRTVVKLSGGLDLAAAPALREQLIAVLQPGIGLLVLDLSCVLSCDTAGLAVLIGTQRRAGLLGAKMCLLAPSLPVMKVLRSTGLDRNFFVYAGPSAAKDGAEASPSKTPRALEIRAA
jgi:anti-anti-sigma factor